MTTSGRSLYAIIVCAKKKSLVDSRDRNSLFRFTRGGNGFKSHLDMANAELKNVSTWPELSKQILPGCVLVCPVRCLLPKLPLPVKSLATSIYTVQPNTERYSASWSCNVLHLTLQLFVVLTSIDNIDNNELWCTNRQW